MVCGRRDERAAQVGEGLSRSQCCEDEDRSHSLAGCLLATRRKGVLAAEDHPAPLSLPYPPACLIISCKHGLVARMDAVRLAPCPSSPTRPPSLSPDSRRRPLPCLTSQPDQ